MLRFVTRASNGDNRPCYMKQTNQKGEDISSTTSAEKKNTK